HTGCNRDWSSDVCSADLPRVMHAACWAHARRKFYDVFEATKSPLAGEALKRIGELYAIEAKIARQPAEARLVARQNCAVPILDADRKSVVEGEGVMDCGA